MTTQIHKRARVKIFQDGKVIKTINCPIQKPKEGLFWFPLKTKIEFKPRCKYTMEVILPLEDYQKVRKILENK